jgi:hypothetical protein
MFRLSIAELLLFVLPILGGIILGKYVGRFANFCVMLAVFQMSLLTLVFADTGEFRPRLLIPILLVWPPLSAGQFIPPLLFVLVSIVVYRLRYAVRAPRQ